MKIKKVEKSSGERISQHFACIADELLDSHPHLHSCGSSDALSVYVHEDEDGVKYDAFCWSCAQVFDYDMVKSTSLSDELGINNNDSPNKVKKVFKTKSKPDPITKEQAKSLIKKIGYVANGYRGIKDEYVKHYGCLTQLDNDNNVLARYYPETEDGSITGYTIRKHPKNFNNPRIGKTGMSSDLYGQVRWKKGGHKYVLIVGGQEDCHAALQMFSEYNKARGQSDYDPFPIVSPTTGEGSAYKQLSLHYDWLDTFDNIVLALDSDKAGQEAIEKCIDVLPSEKVLIVNWSGKDPNDMLEKGKSKQFIRDFYNAKPYFDDGIKNSSILYDAVIEELNKPKLTLPSYMIRMQEMMGGGILSSTITNIIASTSVGKSTHVNNMLYHWIFTAPTTVTIISLEATDGQLGEDLFSIHLGVNLRWMSDKEREEFLNKEETKEKIYQLQYREDGSPRFLIIDDRDADIKKAEKRMEKAYKQYGSKLFIFDVLTDALRGIDSEKQEAHMVWQKMFVKNDIRMVNILHTRKQSVSKDGKAVATSEFDAFGSSTFIQSAAYNIILERDKESLSDTSRNTTRVRLPKCRKGITGKAGDWYFDFKTRQCYDFEDYFGVAYDDTTDDDKPKFKKRKKQESTKNETPDFVDGNNNEVLEGESFD